LAHLGPGQTSLQALSTSYDLTSLNLSSYDLSMFLGRAGELQTLKRAYASTRSELIPIYGRRRVGKSELILQFIKDRPAIYYLGKTSAAQLQIQEFLQEAARSLEEPLLAEVSLEDWKRALLTAVERFRGGGKLVLVFDEFQWMVAASPELPSVLQECWDRHWQKTGKVMLILCGSYVGFMEREVLGKKSPLFGRRTGQILLRPFAYLEAAEFHPRWSLADRARAYFICGGVPLYLRMFEANRSIEQNIEATLLDEFAPLYREPDFLLREELRDVTNYYTLLRAIAAGNTKSRDIADHSGIPERSLHYYIQQLSDLGYVGRAHPLVGKRPIGRNVRYTLDDPLLRFWFRFVFPNTSFIQQRGGRTAFRERIRPELEGYFGYCFERLCREALADLYLREGVSAPFEVGEYWDKRVQIDLVGLREDRWTDLGECKWGGPALRSDPATELRHKAELYPNRRGATLGLRVFTRERPAERALPKDVRWHSLADLYAGS
jgi:uncharacterized protein